jgi:hypothetical protein
LREIEADLLNVRLSKEQFSEFTCFFYLVVFDKFSFCLYYHFKGCFMSVLHLLTTVVEGRETRRRDRIRDGTERNS